MAVVMWLLLSQNLRILGKVVLISITIVLSIHVYTQPLGLFNKLVVMGLRKPEMRTWSLVKLKEGITTTVSLHKDSQDGSLHMYSSGQSIAGDNYIERGDQKMLGHFGILLNQNAKTVLSVGFGSGETTACLSKHDLERVDCVEIAPEIVDISLQYYPHINLGDRLYDEVNMIFMDAKNYIHLTDKTYDVIVNDSIHPRDFAENASLYTKEYFESAKQRLDGKGMILSWIPTYGMPASVFSSIIGTIMEVFPHVTMWYLTPHPAPLVLIAGSEQQQYYSPTYIKDVLKKPAVKKSLSPINVNNDLDVLSCYIGDEDDLRKCVTAFSINSDYWPFVEFSTDASMSQRKILKQFVLDGKGNSLYKHIDWTGITEDEKVKWLAEYQTISKVADFLLMTESTKDNAEKMKYSVAGLAIQPDNPVLLKTRAATERMLLYGCIKFIFQGKTEQAMALADQAIKIYPQSAAAWMIKSRAMQQIFISLKKSAQLTVNDPQAAKQFKSLLDMFTL